MITHLAAALAALVLAAEPEVAPGATNPPPVAPPAPAAAPDARRPEAAPTAAFPPISFRAGVGLGVTREMGKDDANLTLLGAALLLRAGPLVLGPEASVHIFPGAPVGEGGARGVSGSLLLGSGLMLSSRLRLDALAELGFQTYWIHKEGFGGTISGGDGEASFAGARLGLDFAIQGRPRLGVHAVFRHTLGSSTQSYTKSFGGNPIETGEIRYGGFTIGIELAAWLEIGDHGTNR